MNQVRPSPDDGAPALLLPGQRPGGHDLMLAIDDAPATEVLDLKPARSSRPVRPAVAVPTALPADVEAKLAALAGVDPPPVVAEAMPDEPELAVTAGETDFGHRLLLVSQGVAVGALGLLALAAALAARFGTGSLRVHEIPFAAWGLGGAVSAVAAAALATDPSVATVPTHRRRLLGGLLLLALLVCVTGVVTSSGGVAGPAWVLFLPVVVLTGAALGPAAGLGVGALGGAGMYVAAGLSHTLIVAGPGRLVVLLPACPAAGWAAGALAGHARRAAEEARLRRAALEYDVRQLSRLLEHVAGGDLSRVPAPGEHADPVATGLAVVFADTLLALRRLVRQMDAVAQQLAGSAADLAAGAGQDAAAVGVQVSAVTQTTTTIEELAATAGSIAETAVRVSQFAGSTRRDVDAGASAVYDANSAMDVIATRVADLSRRTSALRDRIGGITESTQVIDEIARRTAILAVNASIEAARAGEHGAGFANVAAEVGSLAARAREATARIAAVVADLEREAAATAVASAEGSQAVDVGAALQQDVVDALARITDQVDRTTAAAREITEATRQQRAASDAVVHAMVTVTSTSDRYRSGSQGHAEAAGRLATLAAELRGTIGRFRVSPDTPTSPR